MSPITDSAAAPTLDGQELSSVLGAVLPALMTQQGGLLSVKDAHSGHYAHVNEAMAKFLGMAASAAVGRHDSELFDATLTGALRAAEQTALAQGAPLLSDHQFEWKSARHDFSVLRVVVSAGALGPRWLVAVWLDMASERQRQQQLRAALEQIERQQQVNERLRRDIADQALRDPASGLHRRAQFEDQLKREVDLSTREHREFSIVLIEIDPPGPKVLALGAAGEKAMLEAMGRLIRSGTRAMDAACRFDESRFAVLLSGVGLATAHARMEGLRRQCATQIVVLDGQELGFTVAIGVASFPHTANTQDGLEAACEAAWSEARRRGGNHVTLAAIRFEAD